MAIMVLLMVFVSGFTGLIYQVTWQKYLSVYLGSHALSTSLTLSSFFLFLAVGYHLAGKIGHRLGKNRILTYGYIEGAIGVYAVFSPKLFNIMYQVWPSFPSDSALHFISSVGFALLLLGFPTILMGSTIPLLTQGMSRQLEEGHQVHAWVYGINTFGAFAGTLLAGFYFLEVYGLEQSLNLTGVINCLLCIGVIVFCKLSPRKFEGYTPEAQSKTQSQLPFTLMAIASLSGFLSFGLESLAIRMAGIVLGSSNYTYTIIVSSFIVSIAIGSVISSKATDKNGLRWLVNTQIFLFASVLLLALSVPLWPDVALRIRSVFASSELSFGPYWFAILITFFLFLSIPVTLMGMTLPLVFQQLKRSGLFLSQSAGRMYAVNSVGATLGAVVIGYLAFFFLDAKNVFSILILIAALNCVLVLRYASPGQSIAKWATPLVVAILAAVLIPKWPINKFVPALITSVGATHVTEEGYQSWKEDMRSEEKNRVLFSDYGVNTFTVVTEDQSGERTVYVNGKPDASTRGDRFTRTLTALIPLTLANKTDNVFIIGLGSGMSTGIASSFDGTQSVKVSEIAGGVIKALPYFENWNFKLKDNMNKVEIVNDDAYKVLKNQEQKYDLIFSEPSNTWVTGVEKIYTQEFLKQASNKLKDHGIYSQWFPLFSMSEDSFLSILYNFKSAFEHVTIWSAGGAATIILASHKPFDVDLERLNVKTEKMKDIYSSIIRESAVEILYHQIWSDHAVTEAARGAQISHSLYHPTLAYESARAHFTANDVRLETISEKFFIDPKVRKSANENLEIAKTIEKVGEDQLLWQKFEEKLPESFYEKGVKFLVKSMPFVAGKLSLAKNRLYPKKVDLGEQVKMTVATTTNKRSQYSYLQDADNFKGKILETVDATMPLANELFSRYLQLLAMREKADLNAVLSHVPTQCSQEKVKTNPYDTGEDSDQEKGQARVKNLCIQNKIEIIRFLKPDLTRELATLGLSINNKDKEAEKQVETLYQKTVTEMTQI